MTSYAQPRVIRCPNCLSHLYQRRLTSFNDFGAIGWSDGYTSIWGLNSVSDLGGCPHCKKVFWLEDAERAGILPREPISISWLARIYHRISKDSEGYLQREREWNDTPFEWKNAETVNLPKFGDLITALKDRGSLTSKREAVLRRDIWFKSNDHQRLNRHGKPLRDKPRMTADEAQDNLIALLNLIDSGEKTWPIERGEILRQLGRFDEAIQALSLVEGNRKEEAEQIIGFARQGSSLVRETWRSPYDF